jgi:hypothetical protein
MQLPVDLMATEELSHLRGKSSSEFIAGLRKQVDVLHDFIRTRVLQPVHSESPLSYPVTPIPIYQPGQAIWYKRPIKVRDRLKLDCPWQPANIVKRIGQSLVTYIVRLGNGREVLAHTKWIGPRKERLPEEASPAGMASQTGRFVQKQKHNRAKRSV